MEEMQITYEQVYNADEIGLFFKILFDRTYVQLSSKTAPGLKVQKDRITLMACVNAWGTHKLKPMVIEKSARPRCLRNWSSNAVEYRNSCNAWMTTNLFQNWFLLSFKSQVSNFMRENLPKKALLILDNANCHVLSEELNDPNFRIIFLPPNTTSLVQPLDQNILRCTKLRYRKNLMAHLLSAREDIAVALKKFDLKNVLQYLIEAWDTIQPELIATAWKPLWSYVRTSRNSIDDDTDPELDIPIAQLITQPEEHLPAQYLNEQEVNIDQDIISPSDQNVLNDANVLQEFVRKLSRDCPNGEGLTVEEVFEWNADDIDTICLNSSDDSDENEESENESNILSQNKISHQVGFDSLKIAYEYALQENMSQEICLSIRKARDVALQKKPAKKQCTINQFFNAQP